MATIQEVWARIQAHAGEIFSQLRGGAFSYSVTADHVIPDRTNHQIPKSHFARALSLLPLDNTMAVQDLRGPSYIYAILSDPRIRRGDW